VEPTLENAGRVWDVLASFGAPLEDIKIEDFQDGNLVYPIGIEPNRVDIMMGPPGVEFTEAWDHRVRLSQFDFHFTLWQAHLDARIAGLLCCGKISFT
jgi:hypothetical protein